MTVSHHLSALPLPRSLGCWAVEGAGAASSSSQAEPGAGPGLCESQLHYCDLAQAWTGSVTSAESGPQSAENGSQEYRTNCTSVIHFNIFVPTPSGPLSVL